MSSRTYLTDLPPRPRSDLAGLRNATADIFSLPKIHDTNEDSFCLPTLKLSSRPGSAAPTFEPAPNRSIGTPIERLTISRMSHRRNMEVKANIDAILSAGAANGIDFLRRDTSRSLRGDDEGPSISLDEMMSLLHRAQQGNNAHGNVHRDSPNKRKTLMARTNEMSREGRSTTREEMEKKISTLRADFASRLTFFQDVREMERLKLESRRERGFEVMHRNAMMARCNTPQTQQERLLSACEARDLHAKIVSERKAAVMAEKKQAFEQMVRRANRTGVPLGDPKELERERLALLLASSWQTVVQLSCRANKWFMGLLDGRRDMLRRAAELEERREALIAHWEKILLLQRYFKRRLKRKLIRKKMDAVHLIITFMRAVPRIQYQFRKGVRRMLHRVVSIQRHFRSVGTVRQMRRDEGVKRVDDYMRLVVTKLDSTIAKIQREKKRVESQASMAIKVRKPIFEAQAAQLQETVVQLSKRKFMLAALREESKREMIGAVLKMREESYQARLREFGKEIHDKYMIEFNFEKVLQDRQREIDEELEHQSIVQVKVLSVWTLKRQAALKKIVRPVMSIHVTADDVAALFEGLIPPLPGASSENAGASDEESEREAVLEARIIANAAKTGVSNSSVASLSGSIRGTQFAGSLTTKAREDFQRQTENQFGHR